jgi:hypothetical protein
VTCSIDAPATRDIRKIAVDDRFALDPIAADERESGLAPREVTINFGTAETDGAPRWTSWGR